jgi:hypothetical protein
LYECTNKMVLSTKMAPVPAIEAIKPIATSRRPQIHHP